MTTTRRDQEARPAPDLVDRDFTATAPNQLWVPEAKRGFVLLPRRWVVERSFAWAARCRRLVRDYECLAQTLADMHTVAFSMLMLKKAGDAAQIHNTF